MNLYNELIHTPYSKDFSKEEFLRAPIGMLGNLIKRHMDVVKREANYSSISTARLASIVVSIANGFAGAKNNKPIPIDDLLPFPLDEKEFNTNKGTIDILHHLIKRNKLPVHVIASLKTVISL